MESNKKYSKIISITTAIFCGCHAPLFFVIKIISAFPNTHKKKSVAKGHRVIVIAVYANILLKEI